MIRIINESCENYPEMSELLSNLDYDMYELCDDWYGDTRISIFNENGYILLSMEQDDTSTVTKVSKEEFSGYTDKDLKQLIDSCLFYGYPVKTESLGHSPNTEVSRLCKGFTYKEDVNPFKGLKKHVNRSSVVSKGCVGDGRGNEYEIPTTGRSPKFKLPSGRSVDYDYAGKEITLYSSKGEELDSVNLNVHDWFDGPVYWGQQVEEEFSTDLDNWKD